MGVLDGHWTFKGVSSPYHVLLLKDFFSNKVQFTIPLLIIITSISVAATLIYVAATLISVAATLISVAATLISVAATPISVAATLIYVAATLISVAATLISVAVTLMSVAATPIRTNSPSHTYSFFLLLDNRCGNSYEKKG